MKRYFAVFVVLLLAIGTMAVGMASAQESPSEDPGGELTFTVGTISDMKSVSPFKACCGPEYEMMMLVYDQLLNFDKDTLGASPGIAESWEKNEDATEWTFRLTPGMKWSDGEPVTSEDVKFTIDYVINNRPNAFSTYYPGDDPQTTPKETPTVETPDDLTVVYKTVVPTLAPVMPQWVPILPAHIWSEYEGDIKAAKEARMIPSVGTGPFVLTDWKEGQFWTFGKNPYWRGQEPAIDKIVFRVFDAPESMVQALKAGETDFAEDIPPALFDQLVKEKDPAIETWVASPAYMDNLAFGLWQPSLGDHYEGSQGETPTNHPALLDPQVRVAIAKAIDKETLVDKVSLGYATPGDSIILPRDRWHWDPKAAGNTTQDFDPAEAIRILDEAGYKDTDGDGVREMPDGTNPLIFQFLTLTDSTTSEPEGQYIKGWLADIGIKVELKPVTTGKAYDAWYAHDYDAYIWGWGPDPDPDFMLSIFTTESCDVWSDGCYSNPEFDKLYEEQRLATDEAERTEIVNQMQEIIYNDVPEVILLYVNDLQAWRKDRWTGMVPQPSPDGAVLYGWGPYSYVDLKPVAAGGGGTQAAGESADSGGDSATPWIIVGIVVLVAVIIGIVAMRRRKPAEDRE